MSIMETINLLPLRIEMMIMMMEHLIRTGVQLKGLHTTLGLFSKRNKMDILHAGALKSL